MSPWMVTPSASTSMVSISLQPPSMRTVPSPAGSIVIVGVVMVTSSRYVPVWSSRASPGLASASAFARACGPGNTSIWRRPLGEAAAGDATTSAEQAMRIAARVRRATSATIGVPFLARRRESARARTRRSGSYGRRVVMDWESCQIRPPTGSLRLPAETNETRAGSTSASMFACLIFVHPEAGAPPQAMRITMCPQPPALGRLTESTDTEPAIGEGRQGDQPRRSGYGRHDEAHQRIQDRSRDKLPQWARISGIRAVKALQVARPLGLPDDRRRVPKAYEDEVGQEPSRPTVSVQEWMYPLELGVDFCERLRERPLGAGQFTHALHPVGDECRNVWPIRRLHTTPERGDPMAAEGARPLVWGRIRGRRHLPDLGHGEHVYVTHLSKADEVTGGPLTWSQALLIHPLGSIGVAADLQVLRELLVPDRSALGQECFHLFEDQGVAFDRGRVVGLLVPDVTPDILGLAGRGKSAEAGAQLINPFGQLAVDRLPRWTTAPRSGTHGGNGTRKLSR